MKNILVLIDNSVNSNHLAISAMNIALKTGANITLAHASKKNSTDDNYHDNDLAHLNQKEGMLVIAENIKTLTEHDTKADPIINVKCLFHEGSIIDILVDETIAGSTDLVVIGSHQFGEWEKVMFRTQIQDILENIGCPMLIIPKKFIITKISHTIFAVDLSIGYKNALRYVVAFSTAFGSSVLVNNISKKGFPKKPSEEDLCASINLGLDEQFPAVSFHTIRSTNVKTALLYTMESGNVDLLCLVHKNHDFLRGIFHKSISKQLADNSLVPILILSESY